MAKLKFFFIAMINVLLFIIFVTRLLQRSTPMPHSATNTCPSRITKQTISPLSNTKHLLVSAYMDQRVNGFDIRIIGIFEKVSTPSLHCLFYCAGQSRTTPATIQQHPHYFGFPFIPTDVMCKIPENCDATHVSLMTKPGEIKVYKKPWLPIRKTKGNEEKKLQFNFTVCISALFGGYNNVLQFAQTLEMYRSVQQQHKSKPGGVPGFNILERVYRVEVNRNEYHPYKMIIKPRLVEQTSVHDVLTIFGETFKVPPDVFRMIHSPISTLEKVERDKLQIDKRLWDFKDNLVSRVDEVLSRAGLLS